MKHLLILFFLVFLVSNSFTQKLYSTEDIVINSQSKLAPANIKRLAFVGDSENYSFLENDSLFCSNLEKDKFFSFSLEQLNKLLNLELKSFPAYSWRNQNTLFFNSENQFYLIDPFQEKIKNKFILSENAENITLSPDNQKIAYTLENNIFWTDNSGKTINISNNSDKEIVYGTAVHRNEFGINSGIFWSPKSNYIAFYRMDESDVTNYPIPDYKKIPAESRTIKYPMAGDKSHYVTLGVFSLNGQNIVYLDTDRYSDNRPAEHYLTSVTWHPSEKSIIVGLLNRNQNHLRMMLFDITNGALIKTLFEERDEEYVEPENPVYFLPDNNDKFIFFSERDSWNHLYLYNSKNSEITQLTKGRFEITEFLGFSKNYNRIYFTSTAVSPIERHLYSLELSDFTIKKLTFEAGTHSIKYNESDLFIDNFSSLNTPRKISLFNENERKELLLSKDPILEFENPEIEIIKIKGESDSLYARIVYPTNFDKNKKYPVIVYVYNGPHVQLINNEWQSGRYAFWFRYMAQKGFIIFTVDGRGSANRGLEFEQETFRNLGKFELIDQLAGVNYLQSLQYVDSERIGVYGWSYGGFMTSTMMLKAPDIFKVGVAGGAVIDWRLYEVMYTERYMDTPETNPEGYKESNLLNHIENLNGKLLMIHGTDDPVVVWQHTLLFAQKAVELNKQIDYFPYLNYGHHVGGRDAIHLYDKISEFFINNL